MNACPYCHQTMPHPVYAAHLTEMERRVFNAVWRAGKYGIDSHRLINTMYEDDPNGGPMHAKNCLYVYVNRLNKKLEKIGKKIRSPNAGGKTWGVYRLEDIK